MGITRVGIAEYLRDRQTQREMLLRAEGNACKVRELFSIIWSASLFILRVELSRGSTLLGMRCPSLRARNAVQDLLDNYNRRLWRAC